MKETLLNWCFKKVFSFRAFFYFWLHNKNKNTNATMPSPRRKKSSFYDTVTVRLLEWRSRFKFRKINCPADTNPLPVTVIIIIPIIFIPGWQTRLIQISSAQTASQQIREVVIGSFKPLTLRDNLDRESGLSSLEWEPPPQFSGSGKIAARRLDRKGMNTNQGVGATPG